MKRLLLAVLTAFLPILVGADDTWVRWSPTGTYTNANGTVFYLGTTNVAIVSTLTLNSTAYQLPEGTEKFRIYWKYTGSGLNATNILHIGAGSYGEPTNIVYDTSSSGLMTMTSVTTNAGTFQVSKEFDASGIRIIKPTYIIPGASGGTTSNHFVDVCITRKGD